MISYKTNSPCFCEYVDVDTQNRIPVQRNNSVAMRNN